jgi:hypothetical protein
MTHFMRLLSDSDKAKKLKDMCFEFRAGDSITEYFKVVPSSFIALPGAPFAYWASQILLSAHENLKPYEPSFGSVRVGAQTDDDFRFVRVHWEVLRSPSFPSSWPVYLKGDVASSYYDDIKTVVNWKNDAKELKQFITQALGGGHWSRHIFNSEFFFRPGISWALRTSKFSPSCVPAGCIPSVSRYLALSNSLPTLAVVGLWNSSVMDALCKLRMEWDSRPKFIVGVVKTTPFPEIGLEAVQKLESLAHSAWTLKRAAYSVQETSHAFILPAVLQTKTNGYDPLFIETELANVQVEIDNIAFGLYKFSETDKGMMSQSLIIDDDKEDQAENLEEGDLPEEDHSALLSWCVGVAFGRFDLKLAISERSHLPVTDPFAPLPYKSAGMLPDGVKPFHDHAGLLVDDQGHSQDLVHLVEECLVGADATVLIDVRRWLQRGFFPFHLQCYSKSRRRAPIYWPLATTLGEYTLWLYYPDLTAQTLYISVNDFVEPKLKQVNNEIADLRAKADTRNRDEERRFEASMALELELIELRDTILKLAPTYKPNHDDGVQISAAPLWPLFRHKPWQKILKDTWAKLEMGDYDWAHLAMNYWPDRVREKCRTDKSLAIAHGLEHLYVEPPAKPKKARGSKKASGDDE